MDIGKGSKFDRKPDVLTKDVVVACGSKTLLKIPLLPER
jgi:hypothetical protein